MLNEIAECNVDNTRLYIDRGAMVISEEDYETERDVVRDIGSTGQGVGAAAARRILQRNSQTKLAKDVPEFAPYLCDALDVLNEAFATNGRVCLEGTQGHRTQPLSRQLPLRDFPRHYSFRLHS